MIKPPLPVWTFHFDRAEGTNERASLLSFVPPWCFLPTYHFLPDISSQVELLRQSRDGGTIDLDAVETPIHHVEGWVEPSGGAFVICDMLTKGVKAYGL